MLPLSTSLRCFLRVWFMGAAMTTRGMQHLGLLFAMDPALVKLHQDPQSICEARKRYLVHANTHPLMAPILVGLLISLESLVATKKMPSQNMQRIISTTSETFSAIGDSFFSGTLIVFWALVTTLFILNHYNTEAIIWTCFLLALLLLFRVWFFFSGLRHGLMMLTNIRKLNLINQAQRLKVINSILIVAIYLCIPKQLDSFFADYFGGAIFLALGCVLVNTAHISRTILASLIVLILAIH